MPLIDTKAVSKDRNHRQRPIAIRPEILKLEQAMADLEPKTTDFEDAKRKLWIFAQDQLDYHEKIRLKPLRKKEKVIHKILLWLTWGFYLFIILKVLIEIQHVLHERNWHHLTLPIDPFLPYLNFLLIVVPSVFAVLETVRAFEEWDRNQHEAEKMKGELLDIQTQIFNANDAPALKNASRTLRMALEKENAEWTDRVASLTPGVHI